MTAARIGLLNSRKRFLPWVAVKGGRHSGIVYFNKSAGCRLVQGRRIRTRRREARTPTQCVSPSGGFGQGLLEDNHIDLASMSTFDLVHGEIHYAQNHHH